MVDVSEQLAKLPIYPVLAELRACLCDSIEGETCFCGILVGTDIPMELGAEFGGVCDNVTAYVRLVSSFISTSFPAPDTTRDDGIGRRAYSVAVGIVRAAPIGDQNHAPTAEEERAFAEQLLVDHETMYRAIRCCINDDKFDTIRIAALTYQGMPREGGIGGAEWTFQVQV